MKKTAFFIAITLCFNMMLYSCKIKTVKNTHCVQFIHNSPATLLLPESEMDAIKLLFNGNRLDYTKYQFYQFDKDELGFHHVKCYQFVNNLRVFSEELSFHFNQNDRFYLLSGNLINSIELDTRSSMNQDKVVEIFIQKIEQEKASMVDKDILNRCYEVEFGYVGLDDSKEKFVKAWKIKPTNKDYPYALINDTDSEIIYYDNGVRY